MGHHSSSLSDTSSNSILSISPSSLPPPPSPSYYFTTSRSQVTSISTSEVGMTTPVPTILCMPVLCPSSYGYGFSKIASLAQLYRAARSFPHWMCGLRASWQWGRRARSPLDLAVSFWSSPNILRCSFLKTMSTEDSWLCQCTRHVNCSNSSNVCGWMLHSIPICLYSLWNQGFFSNCLNGPTFHFPLNALHGAFLSTNHV